MVRFLIFIPIVVFGSCTSTTSSHPTNNKLMSVDVEPNFIEEQATTFDLSTDSIYMKFVDYQKLEKYKIDTVLEKTIRPKLENYNNLYFYGKLSISSKNMILFGSYDYYSDFILVIFLNGKVYDTKVIARTLGGNEGSDFEYKKSLFKNDTLFSNFMTGERIDNGLQDIIKQKTKGTSNIYINDKSQIIEDTIEVKKNINYTVTKDFNLVKD